MVLASQILYPTIASPLEHVVHTGPYVVYAPKLLTAFSNVSRLATLLSLSLSSNFHFNSLFYTSNSLILGSKAWVSFLLGQGLSCCLACYSFFCSFVALCLLNMFLDGGKGSDRVRILTLLFVVLLLIGIFSNLFLILTLEDCTRFSTRSIFLEASMEVLACFLCEFVVFFLMKSSQLRPCFFGTPIWSTL